MTETTGTRLTLADKVNRLFDVYRRRDEREQTAEHVARSIGRIIGRPVSVEEVRALREDTGREPDPDLIEGFVRHFAVPAEYLTSDGTRAESVDAQLRLLVAARDAGVKRLALRGGSIDPEVLCAVLDVVKRIPAGKS